MFKIVFTMYSANRQPSTYSRQHGSKLKSRIVQYSSISGIQNTIILQKTVIFRRCSRIVGHVKNNEKHVCFRCFRQSGSIEFVKKSLKKRCGILDLGSPDSKTNFQTIWFDFGINPYDPINSPPSINSPPL